jgi:hypothetical protein
MGELVMLSDEEQLEAALDLLRIGRAGLILPSSQLIGFDLPPPALDVHAAYAAGSCSEVWP